MEEFLVLATSTDAFLIESARTILESAEISVMVEHTTAIDGNLAVAAFRLLIPRMQRAAAIRALPKNICERVL